MVSNEDVVARQAALNTLRTAWAKHTDIPTILTKTQDIARALVGDPPDALKAEVQTAVQKKAAAFIADDRPLEVGIVAGLAARQMIEGSTPALTGWTIYDIWAVGLWSTLQFQVPLQDTKREDLRASIMETSRLRAVDGAEAARQRVDVPDFGTPAGDDKPFGAQFSALTSETIEGLRRNSALDREELDFLWWTLSDRSRLLGRPLKSLGEPARAVAAAIDASAMLRRLPCTVHNELVGRSIAADPELTLDELLEALGADRAALTVPFSNGIASKYRGAFPLLSAMITGDTAIDGATVKRKSSEWAARALLEGGLAHLQQRGPGKR